MLNRFPLDLERNTRIQYICGFLLLFVYAGTFFYPLMDKDAAHHANIALNMIQRHDYLSLIDRERDYLDKPHLLFWVSALSFKIFGVNTFAHRLPALLFSLLALFCTYRLARFLSNRTIAKLALLLLATAQAFVLSISDARMEAPLTAFIVLGTWKLLEYIDRPRMASLVWAAIGAGLAFSTKGWLGPAVIFITAFFYILLHRKWKVLLLPRTWLFLPLFLVCIAPVLYAYYVQFDLHPEKLIRGKSGRSGLHFILWDQLFERTQGFDQQHRGGRNSDYFFLFHTFLWAFFPWSILAYGAVFFWLRRLSRRRRGNAFSFAALSFGFILIAISFSKFKMPHYIIMLLPMAALFTASYGYYALRSRQAIGFYLPVQVVLAVLVLLIALALDYYFFPVRNLFVAILGTAFLVALGWLVLKRRENMVLKFFALGLLLSLTLNFFLFYNFLPSAMQYQGGNALVRQLRDRNLNIPDDQILLVEWDAHSFDFYRKYNHRIIEADKVLDEYDSVGNKYFLLSGFLARHLEDTLHLVVRPVAMQRDYNVATMKLRFLNPRTRQQSFDTLMLARVYRRDSTSGGR